MEEKIHGRETTVAILDGKALPIVEIRPKQGAYDYQNKYTAGRTEYFCPAPFEDRLTQHIQAAGLGAFQAVGGRDYGRVDIMVHSSGVPFVLEVNTLPGMTETSLLPKAAAAAGLSYPALCQRMVELALRRARKGGRLRRTDFDGLCGPNVNPRTGASNASTSSTSKSSRASCAPSGCVWPRRIFACVLGAATAVFLLWRGGDWALDEFVFHNPAFAIQHIEIETDGILPRSQLRACAGVNIGDNLLALDLGRIQRDLEYLPWIQSAAVERVRPQTLRIRVTEREPIAQAVLFQPPGPDGQTARAGFLLRC